MVASSVCERHRMGVELTWTRATSQGDPAAVSEKEGWRHHRQSWRQYQDHRGQVARQGLTLALPRVPATPLPRTPPVLLRAWLPLVVSPGGGDRFVALPLTRVSRANLAASRLISTSPRWARKRTTRLWSPSRAKPRRLVRGMRSCFSRMSIVVLLSHSVSTAQTRRAKPSIQCLPSLPLQ